jgi:hypothetical protein
MNPEKLGTKAANCSTARRALANKPRNGAGRQDGEATSPSGYIFRAAFFVIAALPSAHGIPRNELVAVIRSRVQSDREEFSAQESHPRRFAEQYPD